MMSGTFSQSLFRSALTLLCTVFLIFIMTDFRYSRKTCFLIIAGFFITATCVNAGLLYFFDQEALFRYFLLTTLFPNVILLIILAKDDVFKAQFNFWTQINLFLAIVVISYYGTQALNGGFWTEILLRLTLYALLFFFYLRFLRQPFRLFAMTLKTEWVMISFIPILFFIVIISLLLFPVPFYERPWVLMTSALVYLTMFGVYIVIFITFKHSYDLLDAKKKAEFLDLQVNLQKRQFDVQQQKMEVVRIYRHDMHHHIGIITAFLQDGKTEKANDYAKNLKNFIDKTTYYQFCENYLVNTVLSLYTEQAGARGIIISNELSLPQKTFVEETDLCVIFANALENALNACAKLSISEERCVNLLCFSYPEKLVIEVSNTFNGEAQFNSEGLPISTDKDHGIGTQSIAFIVKKYAGTMHYKVENKNFILQVLLNAPLP